ncbi:MAG: hypothetical protein M3O71_08350 [Bacteroidota bacterium]|nr:hypothetical protein [Bacteroidota bacterium]
MDMQDKEFDQLFRSKLDDFETEPTSQVWDGIVEGLDGKRRYRALLPWLSIAASVILLAFAGILFIPQKHTDGTKPPVKPLAAKTNPQPVVTNADPVKTQPQNVVQPAPVVNNIAAVKHVKAVNAVPANPVASPTVVTSPARPDDQQVIAAAQPKRDIITSVVPDMALSSKTVVGDITATVIPSKAALTASTLPVADNRPAETDVLKPKRSAHGIGGFLNAVIAKVDKRKTKLIEFTDADDDETNVMSINLGALKSKKEEAK